MAPRRHVDLAYEEPTASAPHASPPAATPAPNGDAALANAPLALDEFAVLPEPGDNCAILRCRLEAGSRVRLSTGVVVAVETTVLEGHRIAVVPIEAGGRVLSWGLPFGQASRSIAPGEYLCNDGILAALKLRQIEGLPTSPNFTDLILPHELDEERFCPIEQVPKLPAEKCGSFMGFDRKDAQGGVGTRNYVAIVPTSALASPFARHLFEVLRPACRQLRGGCDGVVPLTHTEAAAEVGIQRPKNWDLLLRTLAGFISHPNVGAALVVGYEAELLSPKVLQEYMEANGYRLPKLCHFSTLNGDNLTDMTAAKSLVESWLPEVDRCERTEQPLSQLRVALQCGGSDAFSGVSGNPAAGTAAKLLIEHGGAAVLAETPELIGAESYVLSRATSLKTAQKFLKFVERYKERFAWHGQSAESNPSGGNKLRGLYNIALKSLGAAKKKHSEVSLDDILEYGERVPLEQRGYYFMDSPGNDLESIAGQVAAGCNAIFFVTGNGSITNFPFVPTIKIVTTSERYQLLEKDMDFNAGQFQDAGVPMDELGHDLFGRLVRMASGERCKGELAGHSQVCIWRDWAQSGPTEPAQLQLGEFAGVPLSLSPAAGASAAGCGYDDAAEDATVVRNTEYDGMGEGGKATEKLGLVLPTSICSGEVARKIADELNERHASASEALRACVDRFVALPHTEGCGTGYAADGDRMFARVMLGHLMHSNVSMALLLEHGCEKTHNGWMVGELRNRGIDPARFGLASIQLDGGVAKVMDRVHDWFSSEAARRVGVPQDQHPAATIAASAGSCLGTSCEAIPFKTPVATSLSRLPLAVLGDSRLGGAAELAAAIVRGTVGADGTVVVPSTSPMLQSAAFLDELSGGPEALTPSLSFAQPIEQAGAHVMQVPAGAASRVEVITGLVAAGVGAIVVIEPGTQRRALPVVGHPMVPVLYVAVDELSIEDAASKPSGASTAHDLVLRSRVGEEDGARRVRWLTAMVTLVAEAASNRFRPLAASSVGFQVARGPTGYSS